MLRADGADDLAFFHHHGFAGAYIGTNAPEWNAEFGEVFDVIDGEEELGEFEPKFLAL